MFRIIKTVDEIREAQIAAQNIIRENRGGGFLGRQIRRLLLLATRYSMLVTPVDTGTLRASHFPEFTSSLESARGALRINRSSFNTKSDEFAYKYGIIVHESTSGRAFYERTYERLISERQPDKVLDSLRNRYHMVT